MVNGRLPRGEAAIRGYGKKRNSLMTAAGGIGLFRGIDADWLS